MATISKQLQGNTSAPTLKLEITPQAYDVENNRTPVAFKFAIERPLNISSSVNKSYSINIGGESFEGVAVIGGSGTKTITSGTVFIDHNADGTKTINCKFSMNVDITWNGTYNGTVSAGANVKLPTIPRATQPTVSSDVVTMGESITITMPRASSKFTHNLKIAIGKYVRTIGTDLGLSKAWTIPVDLANYITNGVSTTAKIWCETYNYGTHIGSKSVSITLKVPMSIIPTAEPLKLIEANTTVNMGVFVEGYSKIKVNIMAKGVYGSEITAITSTLDGVIYKGAAFTTDTLLFSSAKNLETIIADSRGRKVKKVTSINVYAYEPPKINVFTAQRCDVNGTIKPDGQHVRFDYNYEITPLNNKNIKRVVFEYELNGKYTPLKELTSNYSESSFIITDAIFNIDESYNVRMVVYDSFNESGVSSSAKIETDKTTFDVHSSGQGMAFGKVAEESDLFDVAWAVKFRKGLQTESLTDSTYATTPTTDGTKYLGTSSNKWRAIYSSNSVIQPSDRRLKHDIAPIDERYINLFNELKPVHFKRIDGDRVHLGFIAQEVKEAMNKANLSNLEFAGYCADVKDDDYVYSLRYEEFIALNTQMIQMLLAKVQELQEQIKELQR